MTTEKDGDTCNGEVLESRECPDCKGEGLIGGPYSFEDLQMRGQAGVMALLCHTCNGNGRI